MSLPVPPTTHPPVRNARTSLATRIVAAVAPAFLSLALCQTAHAAPLLPIAPSFPAGTLSVGPSMVPQKPSIVWSTALPSSANAADFTYFIRQEQLDTHIFYDILVQSQGETVSGLSMGNAASRYALWAVKATSPPTMYLLDTKTVGTYLPFCSIEALPFEDSLRAVQMTRADQPVSVKVKVNALLSDPGAPPSAKSVTLVRYAQSYGATGTGDPLDRMQAIEVSQTPITTNGTVTYTFPANQIPGENRSKARGEERITILSAPDNQLAASILATKTIQVWPVADGSINGITQGQIIGTAVPQLTFQLNDLYPDSFSFAQVYKGGPQTGFTGTTIPDSSINLRSSTPENKTISIANYGSLFDSDGIWTIELLTRTIFGTDRLAHVSFVVQRTTMTASEWREFHFGTPANSGDGADDNDYDHDGLPNLIEFAFGLNPKQSNAGQLPTPQRIGDELSIRFTPPDNIAGIHHGVEWSTTLQPDSWTPLPNAGIAPEHLFIIPTAGKPSLYLRLTADLAAP